MIEIPNRTYGSQLSQLFFVLSLRFSLASIGHSGEQVADCKAWWIGASHPSDVVA